ncbi:MAG TPA: hypothetical protein VIJ07_10910 [Dermatophilaceae bacterium]
MSLLLLPESGSRSPLAFSCVFGGGLAPFICAALTTCACGSWWPVAIYLMATKAITFCTTLFAPETLDRDLLREEDAR